MLVDIQNERPVGYITLEEYAEKYNVKTYTVRAWERRGKLRTLKITSGGHTILFIPADELLPYLNPNGVARKGRKKVDKLPFPPSEYYTVREFAQKVVFPILGAPASSTVLPLSERLTTCGCNESRSIYDLLLG